MLKTPCNGGSISVPVAEDSAEAGAPGGAASGGGGSDDDDEEEMPPAESEDEDPLEGQNGRDYVPRTAKGQQMAQMLIDFCGLSKSNANTIVVYFGVSTMDKLANFHEEHWQNTFVQWQK